MHDAGPVPSKKVFPSLPLHATEPLVISTTALICSLAVFSLFLLIIARVNPLDSLKLMYRGAFRDELFLAKYFDPRGAADAHGALHGAAAAIGDGHHWRRRSAGAGALVAAGAAHLLPETSPHLTVLTTMMIAGAIAGGLWIALAGSLKYYRGVNETISSLLMNYIAIAILNQMVEGPMHDPESLNTPSTFYIGDANMLGKMFGTDVHWGLGIGLIICLLTYLLMDHTILGFAAKIAGGNIRAARVAGLSVGKITVFICGLAGACAGLAGVMEVAAVQGRANANITAPGYGYTGILVAFIARANPLAVIPVSILIGGIGASGGLLQRRQHLPDATVLVLQGILFLMILAFETFYGRFKIFHRRESANG